MIRCVLFLCLPLIFFSSLCALPSFPGAVGWAGEITGGRGGQIIHVTTLAGAGTGSLRTACLTRAPRYRL